MDHREEALHAMKMAEGLMQRNDFVQARELALKARQLSPDLENIHKLLSVCEVHCSSGEARGQNDWYGILQLDPEVDMDFIKKHYRSLALLLHPDKNKFPGAEAAFKLVGEAHKILSVEEKRAAHDMLWRKIHRKVLHGKVDPSLSGAWSHYQRHHPGKRQHQVPDPNAYHATGFARHDNRFHGSESYFQKWHPGNFQQQVRGSNADGSYAKPYDVDVPCDTRFQKTTSRVPTVIDTSSKSNIGTGSENQNDSPKVYTRMFRKTCMKNTPSNGFGLGKEKDSENVHSRETKKRAQRSASCCRHVKTRSKTIVQEPDPLREDNKRDVGYKQIPVRCDQNSPYNVSRTGKHKERPIAVPTNEKDEWHGEACKAHKMHDGQERGGTEKSILGGSEKADETFFPYPSRSSCHIDRKMDKGKGSVDQKSLLVCPEEQSVKFDRKDTQVGWQFMTYVVIEVPAEDPIQATVGGSMGESKMKAPSHSSHDDEDNKDFPQSDTSLLSHQGIQEEQITSEFLPLVHVNEVQTKESNQAATKQMDYRKSTSSTHSAAAAGGGGHVDLVNDGESLPPSSLDTVAYPVPEFHDFLEDKSFEMFRTGQIWALYSIVDEFPNYYGIVRRVDLDEHKVVVEHLQPCRMKDTVREWYSRQLPVSCGTFKAYKQTEEFHTSDAFSHIVHDSSPGWWNHYCIYPFRGQIWAIFRKWDIGWTCSELKYCEYDIAEIVDHAGSGVSVSMLTKVDGYTAVFRPEREGVDDAVMVIQSTELLRFSHQIPAFQLKDMGGGKLHGCWELDPASLPARPS